MSDLQQRQVKGTKPKVKRWSVAELMQLVDDFIDEAEESTLASGGSALGGFIAWLQNRELGEQG